MPKPGHKGNMHEKHRERLRNRFLRDGLNGFQDHEVLELLLFFSIPRQNTNETAHLLINHFGSLSAALDSAYEELLTIHGVGKRSAVLIRLAGALRSRARYNADVCGALLDGSERAGAFFLSRFDGSREESLRMVCLNAARRVIGEYLVCEGNVWRVSTRPSRIAEIALRANAASVILAHNHPSGSLSPSPEDLHFTMLVRAAMEALDRELSDHIIVAGTDYLSMSASGALAVRRF